MRSTDLPALLETLIPRTLGLLRREFPNGVGHVLHGEADRDVRPRELHPSFYGCFDWHSAVHSCWQVARALRTSPGAGFAGAARATLDELLAPAALEVERAYLEPRASFERPYGLAWLLQLVAELRGWDDDDARRWSASLAPLEALAAARLVTYAERLPRPVRSGAHDQTAFALGLYLDWADVAGDRTGREAVAARCVALYGGDRDAPLAYEPSGTDFLSPALAEADLLRRVHDSTAFAVWLEGFLGAGADARLARHLAPVEVVDPSDGKLAHFAGLNMSRAWMLRAIARALAPRHPLRETLDELAARHAEAGIPLALHDDYMVSHWAPSFVVYLLTNR